MDSVKYFDLEMRQAANQISRTKKLGYKDIGNSKLEFL